MIYLGNEEFELQNGKVISREEFKDLIVDALYSDFGNEFFDIILTELDKGRAKQLINENFDDILEEKYMEGYENGKIDGYEDGYDDCAGDDYDEGYREGYNDGLDIAIEYIEVKFGKLLTREEILKSYNNGFKD